MRSSRRRFDAEVLIRAMVFNRLIEPGSQLDLLDWLRESTSMPGIDASAVHHEQLLRAMDALEERNQTVQSAVAKQLKPSLDQELSFIFYYLTTVRIHGIGTVKNDLRQHGLLSKGVAGVGRHFALCVIKTANGLPIEDCSASTTSTPLLPHNSRLSRGAMYPATPIRANCFMTFHKKINENHHQTETNEFISK